MRRRNRIFIVCCFLSQGNEHSPYIRFKQEFESIINPLVEEIIKTFGLSEGDAEDLLNRMIIFANGIAAFVIPDKDSFSEEAVSRDLSQVCIGIVITDKLRDGTMEKNDGYEVISAPRTTGDGYYESCVLDTEGNQIEITADAYLG